MRLLDKEDRQVLGQGIALLFSGAILVISVAAILGAAVQMFRYVSGL